MAFSRRNQVKIFLLSAFVVLLFNCSFIFQAEANNLAISKNEIDVVSKVLNDDPLDDILEIDSSYEFEIGEYDNKYSSTFDAAVDSDYGYLANYDSGMVIIDLHDPANPTFVSQIYDSYITQSVAVDGDYAYLGLYGLRVIDISDRNNPQEIGVRSGWYNILEIVVDGNLVYLTDRDGGLKILNVTDKTTPEDIGQYDSLGGALDFALDNNYVYMADGYEGLTILDISDKTNPSLIGNLSSVAIYSTGIAYQDNLTFMANGWGRLQIHNVTDRNAPYEVSNFTSGYYIANVEVVGNYAYLATQHDGLIILDISDILNPIEVGQFSDRGDMHNIIVDGNRVYLSDGYDGLEIVDVNIKSNPFEEGQFSNGGYSQCIEVDGDFAYLGNGYGGLDIINISTQIDPQLVSNFNFNLSVEDISIDGNHAYLAAGDDGLIVVDISNKLNPQKVGEYSDGDEMKGIVVEAGYAYIADRDDGLEILNVSDPTNPSQLTQFDYPDAYALNVFVSGNYVYLANSMEGMMIISIVDKMNPVIISNFTDGGYCEDMEIVGDYAFLADTFTGLEIVDISDKANPFEIGEYDDASGSGTGIDVVGDLCFLADFGEGLLTIDVSDRTDPDLLEQHDDGGRAYDVFWYQNYTYVADHTDGLEILDRDQDDDNIPDYYEIEVYGTNPEMSDTDLDDLSDYQEIFTYYTNATNPDSDGDTIYDGEEVVLGDDGFVTNPLDEDTDHDGYNDDVEIAAGTDPTNPLSYPQTTIPPPDLTWVYGLAGGLAVVILIFAISMIIVRNKRTKSKRRIQKETANLVDEIDREIEATSEVDLPDVEPLQFDDADALESTILDPDFVGESGISLDHLSNLLKVKTIIIMEKNGVPLFSIDFAQDIDSALASGFLTAIANFGQEFVGVESTDAYTFSQAGQEGGIFWIFDGRLVRLALLLDSTPTNEFKTANWDLVRKFESVYQRQLEEFTGMVAEFNSSFKLLEEHLFIQYLYPLKINKEEIANHNFPESHVGTILENYLANFGEKTLSIHELINRSFTDLRTLSYSEILKQIIFFVEINILQPG